MVVLVSSNVSDVQIVIESKQKMTKKNEAIKFETNNGTIRFTASKVIFVLLLLNLFLSGFVIGYLVAGRTVQSKWETFFDEYKHDCSCRTSRQNTETVSTPELMHLSLG